MIDAGKNFNDNLTLETLFGWHNAMFESGYSRVTKIRVAQFRESGEMEVVSGRHGREKIHYKAPPMKWIPKEMERFISWFNKSPETLEKSLLLRICGL